MLNHSMKQTIRDAKERFSALAGSRRGRDTITFLIFLAVSTVFWFIMALNDEVQHEFEVPLNITDVPQDITLLSKVPSTVSVNVKDKGTSLIRWDWGKLPSLNLPFKSFQNSGKNIAMNNTQLTGSVRSLFGGGVNIVEVKPDSLNILITNQPGALKPVVVPSDISVSPQHTMSGRILPVPDSVMVFSQSTIPGKLTLATDSVILSGLTDTTFVDVDIQAPEGTKVVPATVRVMIPVEPLIVKSQTVAVDVVDAPDNTGVLIFPSTVNVTYTVPISRYNHDNHQLKVVAIFSPSNDKLPLEIVNAPREYRNIQLSPDSVEFLIER